MSALSLRPSRVQFGASRPRLAKDGGVAAGRRFIGVFSANGTVASEFFPGCVASLSKSPNSCPTAAGDTPLTAGILGRILQPLAAHTSQMLVLKGVDMISTVSDVLGVMSSTKPGGPHMKGPGAMLTGGSLLAGSFREQAGPQGTRIVSRWTNSSRTGSARARRFRRSSSACA